MFLNKEKFSENSRDRGKEKTYTNCFPLHFHVGIETFRHPKELEDEATVKQPVLHLDMFQKIQVVFK